MREYFGKPSSLFQTFLGSWILGSLSFSDSAQQQSFLLHNSIQYGLGTILVTIVTPHNHSKHLVEEQMKNSANP